MTPANSTANPAAGQLAVEGQTDLHFVFHLCRMAHPGLETRFSLQDYRGRQGVLNAVRGLVNRPDITAVGILLDADDDPMQRWRDVTARITEANPEIQVPPAPVQNGTIIPENPDIDNPRIGIWIMPDNSSTGEMENFVTPMIPAADQVWPLSQAYIGDIPAPHRKFDDSKITKSQVHAWLAARKYPGLLGRSVREGDLEINGTLCQTFLTWLKDLFA